MAYHLICLNEPHGILPVSFPLYHRRVNAEEDRLLTGLEININSQIVPGRTNAYKCILSQLCMICDEWIRKNRQREIFMSTLNFEFH